MDIRQAMMDERPNTYVKALSINSSALNAHLDRCQELLDNPDPAPVPMPSWYSDERTILGSAIRYAEGIVVEDWLRKYTRDEMQTMCRLLDRCPEGKYALIGILRGDGGIEMTLSEILRRYNEIMGTDICFEAEDIG